MPRLRSKNPIDSTYLSEKLKNLRLDKDNDNDLPALPIIPFNLYENPATCRMPVVLQDPQTPAYVANVLRATALPFGLAYNNLLTIAMQCYYNPALAQQEAVRTPTVFRNVTALNNGTTAIWTAGANVRWRLMGICVTLMKATTAAGACKLTILDVAADTGIGVDICAGAMTAVPGGLILLQGSFGNGILAAATNTALNANLSSALAAGGVSIQVWGTEE